MISLVRSVLVSLFLITSVWAAGNPLLVGHPPQKIMGFRGLDTQSSAPNVEEGRAVDVLNVKLSSALSLQKRYGLDTVNNASLDDLDMSAPAINGIFDTEYSNGNSWTLVFVGNKLKYDNSGTWAFVHGAATITTGQNNQFVCLMALDNAICTNDADKPLQVNSTPTKSEVSFSGLSSPVTKAKAVIFYRNYLIFGNTVEGGTDKPTRFRWSNVGTIGTWSNNDFNDIASLAGDEIIGFQELYGDLYIFMKKSIWKASLVGGNDTFVFNKVIEGVGAIAKNSIRPVSLSQNRLVISFLSEEKKIFLFDGVVVQDIGRIIQPTLDDLSASRLEFATAVHDGQDLFISVTGSGESTNDLLLDFQTEIFEWTKHDQIDANYIARVKESTSLIKTYVGNYNSFVYWLDNPDNYSDVDGATGIVDSVGTLSNIYQTGAQIIIDTGLAGGSYTGAIIRITSGTGEGQERLIMSGLSTGVIVASSFSTTLDSTSNYSIGDIDANYYAKWYDFGDASRYKSFRSIFFWAKEASDNQVTVGYAEDFGVELGATIKSLSPSSSSLWDSAVWDTATWGTTGDKLYTVGVKGNGRFFQPRFSNTDIDKSFLIYGFHMLADRLDVE